MKTVWAVTRGSYSDYHVLALFTTKHLAEQAMRADNADENSWGDADIESFGLYDAVPDPFTVYHVTADLWDDGTMTAYREWSNTNLPWNHYETVHASRPNVSYVRAPVHHNKGGRLAVASLDRQLTLQAFGDRKAAILAKRLEI